jgi:hypothetical protein
MERLKIWNLLKGCWKMNRIPLSELILLMCVAFSIGFSLFLFLVLEEKMLGLFIGMWAPTIMGLINYINIKFKR